MFFSTGSTLFVKVLTTASWGEGGQGWQSCEKFQERTADVDPIQSGSWRARSFAARSFRRSLDRCYGRFFEGDPVNSADLHETYATKGASRMALLGCTGLFIVPILSKLQRNRKELISAELAYANLKFWRPSCAKMNELNSAYFRVSSCCGRLVVGIAPYITSSAPTRTPADAAAGKKQNPIPLILNNHEQSHTISIFPSNNE